MRFFLLIAVVSTAAFAQFEYWPEVLRFHMEQEQEDSNGVDISANQNLRQDIYKLNSTIQITRNDSIKRVEQRLSYDLFDDNSLELQNHFLDLSGLFLRKRFPFSRSSLGMEWVPTFAFNRRPDLDDGLNRSNGIGSMRLGPVIRLNYLNMPMHVSGGAAYDVWNPMVPFNPGYNDLAKAKADPGFYGSVRMGDNQIPLIEGIPFYAEGSIFGRYMNSNTNAKITNGEINALYFSDIAFADTFFVYVADTLSKGRTAFLSEQAGGAARYSSTPSRTNNSLQAACGLKNIGKFILKPSLAYSLSLSSVSYPSSEKIIGDERLMTHTFSLMGQNDTSTFLDYSGGIAFTYEDEDWLYKDELSIEATEENKDSLIKNLQDYEQYSLRMFHTVEKRFANTFGISYSFFIHGDKKIYPNYYTTAYGSDPVRYVYDKDNVDLNHRVNVTLFSFPRIRVSSLIDYYRNKIVYLRKEKSSLNKTERTYRMELTGEINPDSAVGLDATIGAFAKEEEYHFPEYHDDTYPMSRRYYSRIKGRLGINNKFLFEGIWSEMYLDNGNYVDSLDKLFLVSQTLESSFEFTGSYRFPNNFVLQLGSLFRYIYLNWDFNSKDKIFYMTPFIEIGAFLNNRAFINARIERYIDPDADDHWEAFSQINVMF